jgi:hypothetical protein
MSDKAIFTACGSCNRGGNGNDKDKCSCGWQEYDITSKGCFCGTAGELYEAIKKSPKIVQEYIIAQRHALDGYKSTLGEAMKKIFELSAKIQGK